MWFIDIFEKRLVIFLYFEVRKRYFSSPSKGIFYHFNFFGGVFHTTETEGTKKSVIFTLYFFQILDKLGTPHR